MRGCLGNLGVGEYHDESAIGVNEGWRGVPQAMHSLIAHISQQRKISNNCTEKKDEEGDLQENSEALY